MKVKYVILDHSYPVLFGQYWEHTVARRLGEPTSAGFCEFAWNPMKDGWNVRVWGESIGLTLKSHPEDAGLIARMLGN